LVKMKQKKMMMIFALVLSAAILYSTFGVYAAGNMVQVSNVKATPLKIKMQNIQATKIQSRNKLQSGTCTVVRDQLLMSPELEKELDTAQLEVIGLEEIIAEYKLIPEEDKQDGECVWILFARGYAWDENVQVDDVATPEGRYHTGMRIIAKPVWASPWGLFYEVTKGVVGLDGTRYEVTGYGLAKNGYFYMSLDGEDLSFQCVGKIFPLPQLSAANCPPRRHRVVMKGNMVVEGKDYTFKMRGWTFRRCIN
jgi:hypothetical protein